MSADVCVIRSAECVAEKRRRRHIRTFFIRACIYLIRGGYFFGVSLNANIPRMILNVYFLCCDWSSYVITRQGLNEKPALGPLQLMYNIYTYIVVK